MTFARRQAERHEQRTTRKEANLRALATPAKGLKRGVYAPASEAPAPAPKTEAYRDAALLEMAKDRPCLLMVLGVCSNCTETTVAAHSNLAIHGKGKSRKADDCYSVWSCNACHCWLDQGASAGREKRFKFMAAHARQVLEWRRIASDLAEPARYRQAAMRALRRLNAA